MSVNMYVFIYLLGRGGVSLCLLCVYMGVYGVCIWVYMEYVYGCIWSMYMGVYGVCTWVCMEYVYGSVYGVCM